MRLRHKLTLYFSLASALIILAFGTSVYFFSAQYRENEFYERLKTRVEISEKFFLERATFTADDYTKIREQFLNTLPNETEEVAPLSTQWKRTLKHKYPAEFLDAIVGQEEVYFHTDTLQGAARVFHLKDGNYAVIITAVDKVGMRVLRNLRTIITLSIMVCIIVISILSYYISKHLTWPISKKIHKANTITGTNLHERLIVYNPDDELGEMAVAFNKLLDRVEEAFMMQKSFVANASHEIRNPLTAILGETEVVLTKDRSIEEYKESLRSISAEAERLNVLINNLFQLSSLNSNAVNIKREIIYAIELINESRKKYDLLNPNNELRIFLGEEVKWRKPAVKGNKNLLETAMVNIMDNASKFSFNGVVEVETGISDGELRITVTDKGVGIPPDDIPKITQPFFRAENVRQITGTGIGIPLTLRIVEIHGGRLEVRSVLGTGTIVDIFLPVTDDFGLNSQYHTIGQATL